MKLRSSLSPQPNRVNFKLSVSVEQNLLSMKCRFLKRQQKDKWVSHKFQMFHSFHRLIPVSLMFHNNKTNHAQQPSNGKKFQSEQNKLFQILKLKKIMLDTQLYLKCLKKAVTMEVEAPILRVNSKQLEVDPLNRLINSLS